MLLTIPDLLSADELQRARGLLQDAPWSDGRATGGPQAALAKNNEQLPAGCEAARALQAIVRAALGRHALFFAAALPRRVLPALFNRYRGTSNAYGSHIDQAIQFVPDGGERVRSDLSCTLFLSDPADYDGGELVIEDGTATQRARLPAGHLLLYPSNRVHRVEPVTRGERVASFFWIESMVRDNERRRLLFEMDRALMRLRERDGESAETLVLTGTYHNLLRMWADA